MLHGRATLFEANRFTQTGHELNTLRSAEFQLHSSDRSPAEREREADNLLRQQVTERLAAHRSRRDRGAAPAPTPERSPSSSRANQIAATVAERYARSQSYRDFLAAESQRAIDEANAAAEIAARNAIAIEIAQQQLMAELEQARLQENTPEIPQLALVPAPEPRLPGLQEHQELQELQTLQEFQQHPELQELVSEPEPPLELSLVPPPAASTRPRRQATAAPQSSLARNAAAAEPDPRLTVRLFGELGPIGSASSPGARSSRASALRDPFDHHPHDPFEEDERIALDEEIAFRQTPVFEEPASPPEPLPANLLEFPRQLVASRKARPRFAEGPLREEAEAAASSAQLRIFEVETTQIASHPRRRVHRARVVLHLPRDAAQPRRRGR